MPPQPPMTEEDVIRLIQSLAGQASDELYAGIGDDCAVLTLGGHQFCVTTDLLVQGVHFDPAFVSPFDLGRKAMAANLSDLAAMGARPRWGFLSLGLPARPERELVEALLRGCLELGREHGLTLAGGDTVRAGELVINLCLIGAAEAKAPLMRSGARRGDAVCVTGRLGASAAGLAWLQAGHSPENPAAAAAVEAHLRPMPRVAAGRALAQSGRVHAMMDISDGLATDLARLTAASQCGARVRADKVPVGPATAEIARELGGDALEWALSGGEDFELLLTCTPGDVELLAELVADSEPGLTLTKVGEITSESGVHLIAKDKSVREITFTGFDHFREDEPA